MASKQGTAVIIGAGPAGLTAAWELLARTEVRPEKSLEDFLVNRFGRELYATFFRDYTEKVWGVPCDRIAPEWGMQRIKGLSIRRAARMGVIRRLKCLSRAGSFGSSMK
jgi:protoporphyrinogen oxidase